MKDLKISKKLQHSFTLTILCFLVAIIFSIGCLNFIGSKFNHFFNSSYLVVSTQWEMQKSMQEAAKNILWATTTSDVKDTQDRLDTAQSELTRVRDNLALLKTAYKGNPKDLDAFNQAMLKTVSIREELFNCITSNDNETALEMYNTIYAPAVLEARDVLIRIGEDASTRASEAYKNADATEIIAIIFCILISFFSLIITILSARKITKMITSPVKEIERAANEMSNGSLHANIEYQSKDELGSLAESMRITTNGISLIVSDIEFCLKTMADGNFDFKSTCEENYIGDYAPILSNMEHIATRLSAAINEIKDSASQVAQGSENMASGAQTLAEGATDQASAVEELTASINEITAQVEETSEGANVANDMALLA
ncbi:MAG: methyl-accepting chemotaxis protein, partial [Acetivibrio sp.]